jgi:pimeloyl-ACP methyl ester carboxylesterase
MRPCSPRRVVAFALALLTCFAIPAPPSAAEEVRLEHLGLGLLANLEVPPAQTLAQVPVALLLHGTLAHHDVEIIKTLQAGLKSRGIASLAMTLSLGLDNRRGAFDCARQHDHRASDAVDEIGAWVAWLDARGAKAPVLIGHSRGAQQVVSFALTKPTQAAGRLILLAPLSDTAEMTAERYRSAFSGDLAQALAAAKKLIDAGEDDTLIEVPGFLYCRPAKVTAAAFVDYYDPQADAVPLGVLDRIQVPVLVVAGSDDRIAPDVVSRLASRPPSPHVTLHLIDGADHFFRDLFADDLADAVAAFIHKP